MSFNDFGINLVNFLSFRHFFYSFCHFLTLLHVQSSRNVFLSVRKSVCGMPPRPQEKFLRYNTIQDNRPNTIKIPYCMGWAPFWVILESSQNGVCLAGKSFPHPVGVFCTHLEPPKSHIRKKKIVPKLIYLLYNFLIIPYRSLLNTPK